MVKLMEALQILPMPNVRWTTWDYFTCP